MRRLLPLAALPLALACATDRALRQENESLRGEVERLHARDGDQQKRIAFLENRVGLLSSQREARPAVSADPRVSLPTTKLAPSANPVLTAPRLPTEQTLEDPPADLEAATVPKTSPVVDADAQFASAVQRFNEGDHAGAARDFEVFAERFPKHLAAGKALYLCGLAHVAQGDCASALPWFEKVEKRYPTGDAVAGALLEQARCAQRLKRISEARDRFERVSKRFPESPEAAQARLALGGM